MSGFSQTDAVSGFSRTDDAEGHEMSHSKPVSERPDRRAFLSTALAALAAVPAAAMQQGAPPAIPPEQPRD